MAISIDTVYQRVLAMANKEQRGYVTPQEFNLFANQAQMEIFEQYFYDAGQFSRMPKAETPRTDVVHLLEEKISIFKKRHQPVVVGNAFGDATLPDDVYRLDNVLSYNTTDTTRIIEEITEDELITYSQSPLAKPTSQRPVYLRTSATKIKIYPYSGITGTALFFTSTGSLRHNSNNRLINITGGNLSIIKVNQTVTQGSLLADTKITSIAGSVLTIDKDAQSGGSVTITFASGDIKCNYIKKPADVNWGYTEINGSALYNSTSSTDFELHQSEEARITFKILALAGINLGGELYSIGSQEEMKITQQEKQ